ncbi:hypothetical protein [Kitasatospora sp. NPDC058190]|uniref:hypothetical protein n=1 Tax=Kitasatospora sp. NPDC058190 TaxID=3346371 RepID=UPI0036DE3BFA
MATFTLVPGADGRAWFWHRLVPELRAPDDSPNVIQLPAAAIRRRRVVGGLLNEYRPAPITPSPPPQEAPRSVA